jgi:type I restriction enzyme, S subunit
MLLLEQFEHLTLHPKNAARLKELVLQLAVQGKLTENWRKQNPDIEPAAELLKRIEAEKAQLMRDKKLKKIKPVDLVSDDDAPYTLPIGWAWCQMEGIVEIKSSNIKGLAQGSEDDIPYIKVGDMNSAGNETEILTSSDYFSVPVESIHSCIPIRSIIFPKRGGAIATNKRRKVLSRPILIDSNMMAFTVPININYDYVYRWFETIDLGKLGNNGVIPQINNQDIYPLFIPLPPLAEQEAIVARVEELMQKIEELEKQSAERIRLKKTLGAAALQQLTAATNEELEQNWLFLKQHFTSMFDEEANVKKLRETILQLAVQGKLTATWRTQNPTTEPAIELLKRIQAEKAQLVKDKKIKKGKPLEPISEDEVPYTLPEGWVWCRLTNVGFITGGGTPDKGKKEFWNGDIPWVSPKDMGPEYVNDSQDKITKEGLLNSSANLIPINSLLIVGRSGILKRKLPVAINKVECTVNQDLKVIVPYVPEMSLFLQKCLKGLESIILKDFVKYGMTVHSLKYEEFKHMPIPIPPLTEQKVILAKVDQLMKLCDGLEQQIQQSKKETEALMQAVVQEALQVQEMIQID